MCREKDPLLSYKNGKLKFNTGHVIIRLISPFSVATLSYFAIWIQVYCLTEWIQHTVKVEMFGNETLHDNSSACTNKTNPDYKKLERVQQETAHRQMYLTMTVKFIGLFTTFLFTVYTDSFGRRFLFILSTFSITLYFFLTAIIILFNLEFIYLILAHVAYGLTGTSYGLLAVTYSYIADITEPGKQRAICIFAADIGISVAGTAGALVVGIFIEASGFVYPAFTAAGIALIALLVSVLFIPESVKAKDKVVRPKLLKAIVKPFQFYYSKMYSGYRLLYLTLLFAFIFADMTGVNRKPTESLYQLGMPFCWSPSKIGLFATLNAAAANFFGMSFLRIFQKCLSTVIIALIGICTTAGAFVLEALARTDIVLYLVSVPACLSNLPSPLIRSTLSTMTSSDNQGALSAGLSLVQTVCSFVTGIIDNSVYAATISLFNGFIFFVFAMYCVLCAISLVAYIILKKKKDNTIAILNISEKDLKKNDEDIESAKSDMI